MKRPHITLRVLLIPLMIILMMSSSILFMIYFGFIEAKDIQKYMSFRRIIIFSFQSLIWVMLYYKWIRILNNKLPWRNYKIIRFCIDAVTVLFLSFISIAIFRAIPNISDGCDNIKHLQDESLYIMPLMTNTIFISLIELILAFDERNLLEVRVARLEQLHISSKYRALKEQLDHHFLFNNLSVLSSIIYEDADKADLFIQKLSNVYRYVLSLNKQDLISVKEELAFIESYLQLYKYRFEEGIEYEIHIDLKDLKHKIPPLSLQLLVENAIKHNVVSRSQPLLIKIFSRNHQLIVENNIQPRSTEPDSTQTGLNNLCEKYRLLKKEMPMIAQNDKTFTVTLFLISPNQ